MPDIALYNPPVWYYARNFFGQLPAYGVASVSAVLNRAGMEASVIDMEAAHLKPGYFYDHPQPPIIGFTCLSMQAQGVRDCILAIRKSGYKDFIVVGGVHATIQPAQVLGWGADLVVTGECEGNIVQLLQSGAEGIHKGEPMAIDDLPLPDWEHYAPAIETYAGQYAILHPRAGVSMWTRGCPYSCIYCSDLIFNHQPKRHRKPAAIAAEMAYLKSRGITNVFVYDDEIIGSKAPDGWMREVADLLEPLRMRWIAQARCSQKYVTPEVLREAKRAGCAMLLWGVESFSGHVLSEIHKHATPADIWHSLHTAHDAGIANSVFLMIGNYHEEEADCQITRNALRLAYRAGLIDFKQVFVAKPMEGTEMERRARAEGWYVPPAAAGAFMKTVESGTPWLPAQTMNAYKAAYHAACPVPQP